MSWAGEQAMEPSGQQLTVNQMVVYTEGSLVTFQEHPQMLQRDEILPKEVPRGHQGNLVYRLCPS